MNRTWLRWTFVVLALASFVFALFVGFRTILFIRESSIVFPSGSDRHGPVAVEAARIEIAGDIAGDVNAQSLFYKQTGDTSGQTTVVSGLVELRGTSHGNVRIRAANARIYGTINGDVLFEGGSLQIMEGARIAGNLTVRAGTLAVIATSTIDGHVQATAVEITIEGHVTGDVSLSGRSITITDGAQIDGAVTWESGSEIEVGSTAEIGGPLLQEQIPGTEFAGNSWPGSGSRFVLMLLVLVSGGLAALRLRKEPFAFTGRPTAVASIVPGAGLLFAGPVFLMLLGMYLLTLPIVVVGAAVYFLIVICLMGRGLVVCGWIILPGSLRTRALANMLVGTLVFAVLLLASPNPMLVPVLFACLGAGAWIWHISSEPNPDDRIPPGRLTAGISGFLYVAIGLTGVTLGFVATAAAVVTLTGSAALVWEYSPIALGVAAWLLATCALALVVYAYDHAARPARVSN